MTLILFACDELVRPDSSQIGSKSDPPPLKKTRAIKKSTASDGIPSFFSVFIPHACRPFYCFN